MAITLEDIKALKDVLRLTIGRRKFIMINGEPASNSRIQKIWNLPMNVWCEGCRMNWFTDDEGLTKAGYKTPEQYEPVIKCIIEWLEKLGVKDPEPCVTIQEGYKIYFNGTPVGPKLDYDMTKDSKYSFPKEFYKDFCVSFDKDECLGVVKKQMLYMIDQLKLKGRYGSLGEKEVKELKEMKYL